MQMTFHFPKPLTQGEIELENAAKELAKMSDCKTATRYLLRKVRHQELRRELHG